MRPLFNIQFHFYTDGCHCPTVKRPAMTRHLCSRPYLCSTRLYSALNRLAAPKWVMSSAHVYGCPTVWAVHDLMERHGDEE